MEKQQTRSVIVKKFGGYDSLSVEDADLQGLDGLIEVAVEYGGVNFADLYVRKGLMALKKNLPFVLGMECSGTITAIGTEATELKVGQKVICYDYGSGLYRDIIRVTPDKCYPLPDFVDLKTGAAIFVNYLTAYFALIELGNLKRNEKVLLLSCAGGVGCAATQLARTIENVKVYGTGSNHKESDARKNGVDVFYSNETFETEVETETFDLIITNTAGPVFSFLENLLNPLGRIIIIGASNLIQDEHKFSALTLIKAWWTTKNISPESLIMNNRAVAGVNLGTLIEKDAEKVKSALNHMFDLYTNEKIKPIIHSVWPMSKIVDATKLLADRKNVGKVLIYMKATNTSM